MKLPWLLAGLLSLMAAVTAPAAAGDAWLGISVSYQMDPSTGGGRMTVATVYPEGPAATAGLKVGDVITEVHGVAFQFPDWTATVAKGGPFTWVRSGERVRFSVSRHGKAEVVEIVAAEMPPKIVEERRRHQEKVLVRRGPELLDRLARQGSLLRLKRETQGGPISVAAEGLGPGDAVALARFLEESRLRDLFARLQAGQTMKVRLGLEPLSEEMKIEVIP